VHEYVCKVKGLSMGRIRVVCPPGKDEDFFCLWDVLKATRGEVTEGQERAAHLRFRKATWFVEERDLYTFPRRIGPRHFIAKYLVFLLIWRFEAQDEEGVLRLCRRLSASLPILFAPPSSEAIPNSPPPPPCLPALPPSSPPSSSPPSPHHQSVRKHSERLVGIFIIHKSFLWLNGLTHQ